MPKYTVIDKFGTTYSVEADYVLATDDCQNVSFINKTDDLEWNKVVAQFTRENIIGFYDSSCASKVEPHSCDGCKYEHLDCSQEPCHSCNDNCDKWEAKE